MAANCVYKCGQRAVALQYGATTSARLVRRYKRFLADVLLSTDSEAVTTCHCPNTGPMTGLLDRPSAPVVLSVHDSKARKYAHSLEMIQPAPGGPWVGVHSAIANKCVAAMLEKRLIQQLEPYDKFVAEVDIAAQGKRHQTAVKVQVMLQIGADESLPAAKKRRVNAKAKLSTALAGKAPTAKPARKSSNVKTRCDFMLVDADGGKTFVEVKSVTLAEDSASPRYKVDDSSMHAEGVAGVVMASVAHPDINAPRSYVQVSERALRHIEDLVELQECGHKAACVFLIQRADCEAFAPCHAKDPKYGAAVCRAHAAGVRLIPLLCELDPGAGEIKFLREVPCVLEYGMPAPT